MTNHDTNTAETLRAQDFARDVYEALCRIRGWSTEVPRKVREDIWKTIDRYSELYSKAFSRGLSPETTAQTIQNREWDR
jgi:hypothetical protein